MCWLVSLNKYSLVPLLVGWVDINSFSRLDTALANNRDFVTELIKEFPEKFRNVWFQSAVISIEMLLWCSSRGLVIEDAIMPKNFVLSLEKADKMTKDLIFPHFKKLHKLMFYNYTPTNMLTTILHSCRYVVDLDLSHYCGRNVVSCALMLDGLPKYCQGLQKLNLDGVPRGNLEYITRILRKCKKLTDLNVGHYIRMCDVTAFFMQVAIHGNNLKVLSCATTSTCKQNCIMMYHCRPALKVFPMGCKGIDLRVSFWKLQPVSIFTSKLSNSNISELSLACPQLTKINLTHDNEAVNLALLVSKLPKLQSMNLQRRKVTDSDVHSIMSIGKAMIRELCIDDTELTVAGLISIATHGNLLEKLFLIKVKLTDEMSSYILQSCPNLREVDFSWNAITDAGFLENGVPVLRKGLVKLWIRECHQLTDVTLSIIAKHCNLLTDLNIGHNHLMTESGVISIIKHLPKLTRLSLNHIKIAFKTAVVLSDYHPPLVFLNIIGCKFMESSMIESILRSMKTIRELKCDRKLRFDPMSIISLIKCTTAELW